MKTKQCILMAHSHTIESLLVLLTFCFFLASCATSKRVLVVADPDRDVVMSHCQVSDAFALLHDLDRYPAYRQEIEESLYHKDYSSMPYNRLEALAAAAINDFTASEFFDSLLVTRQLSVIDRIADMSISDMGEYYCANYSEQSFLHDLVKESVMDSLPGKDYTIVKAVHEAFGASDLAPYVEPLYTRMRQELIDRALSDLDICYQAEDDVLEAAEYNLRNNLESYIRKGVETIMYELDTKLDRGLFKKIFKREEKDKYSFEGYAKKMIEENLSISYIGDKTEKTVDEFVSSSTLIRRDFLDKYFDDYATCDSYYLHPDSLRVDDVKIDANSKQASEIQGIKDQGALLSIASLAMAFTPYGWLSFALDAADLYYGLTENSKIAPVLESMASTLYGDTSEIVSSYLDTVFSAVKTEKARSEEYAKQKIYEVY